MSATKKTEEEIKWYPEDGKRAWSIICDSAYQGCDNDSPGAKRWFVNPKPTSIDDVEQNQKIISTRIVVEWFFGRIKQLWGIASGIYKESREHLDQDIDCCFWLTNEHIKQCQELGEMDHMRFFAQLKINKNKNKEVK